MLSMIMDLIQEDLGPVDQWNLRQSSQAMTETVKQPTAEDFARPSPTHKPTLCLYELQSSETGVPVCPSSANWAPSGPVDLDEPQSLQFMWGFETSPQRMLGYTAHANTLYFVAGPLTIVVGFAAVSTAGK